MYSENAGVSWATVAQNVHPHGSFQYRTYDFNWLVIITMSPCPTVCIILYTRGEPGIDWDINNASRSDITKVFYSVYDPNADSISGKSLCTYARCVLYIRMRLSRG